MVKNTKKARLKENRAHGDTMFPFSVYDNKFRSNETTILNHHWHQEIEFFYLKKGKLNIQLDSEEYVLKPEEALLINSGVIHSAYSNQKKGEYCAIVFDLNLLNSHFEDNCQLKFINPILHNHYGFTEYINGKEKWSKQILKQLEKIIEVFLKKKNGFELAIKSALYQILYQLISNQKLKKFKKEDTYKIERLKKVLLYIHNHYQEDIHLQDMADVINVSKYHFSHFFKSLTGITPIDYLNSYRIKKACILLDNKNRLVLDIALAVGFNNFSYFIKTFKKYKGCTPSEYRT